MDEQKVSALQQQLSAQQKSLNGVEGFGFSEGNVNVYLSQEHEPSMNAIRSLVENTAPGTPVRFVMSGKFRAF